MEWIYKVGNVDVDVFVYLGMLFCANFKVIQFLSLMTLGIC